MSNDRVTKDQQRAIERHYEDYAKKMHEAFTEQVGSVVDCDIAFVDQTTYAEFIQSLNNPSCSYTFDIEPLKGPAIVDYSLPVAFGFITNANGTEVPKEARVLTANERDIMAKVITRNLADMEANWEPIEKISVAECALETNPEYIGVADPGDTVILVAFEVHGHNFSGLVNVCYPYKTLEPVLATFN